MTSKCNGCPSDPPNGSVITARELEVMGEALGARGQEPIYRNHFFANPFSDDYPTCESLVAKGLMERHTRSWSPDYIYTVTPAGYLLLLPNHNSNNKMNPETIPNHTKCSKLTAWAEPWIRDSTFLYYRNLWRKEPKCPRIVQRVATSILWLLDPFVCRTLPVLPCGRPTGMRRRVAWRYVRLMAWIGALPKPVAVAHIRLIDEPRIAIGLRPPMPGYSFYRLVERASGQAILETCELPD